MAISVGIHDLHGRTGCQVIFDGIFLKFISVGVVNTVVGSGLMFVLYNFLGFGYWLSSTVSYIAGSILSFFLNKYWTFGVRKWSVFVVAAFALNIAICYFLAYKAARTLIHALPLGQPENVKDNIAMLVGICLFTGLNYLGQRFVVFRRRGLRPS